VQVSKLSKPLNGDILRFLQLILLALLPSSAKVFLLKQLGHQIGKNVRIGFSFLDVNNLTLGDNVNINSWNYFKNIQQLEMKKNSRIGGRCNWFTCSENNKETVGSGHIIIGEGSNITSKHYFDVQEIIHIGNNTMIAGSNSVFYTHTVTPTKKKVNKPVVIGSNCYIGSHCLLVPGAIIGDSSFVAAGSVVSRDFSKQNFVLLAGNPAQIKKHYDKNSSFFISEHNGFKPSKSSN